MKKGSSQFLTPVSPQARIPLPAEQRIITVSEAIGMLKGYALERRTAINAYKSVINFGDKNAIVENLLLKLKDASEMTDNLKIAFTIIRMERSFMFIAPRKNITLYNTYADKIEAIMTQFREFVIYLKSKNQTN